jgi:hypothetical protein
MQIALLCCSGLYDVIAMIFRRSTDLYSVSSIYLDLIVVGIILLSSSEAIELDLADKC